MHEQWISDKFHVEFYTLRDNTSRLCISLMDTQKAQVIEFELILSINNTVLLGA